MQVHLLDVHSACYEKSDLSACTRRSRRISLSLSCSRSFSSLSFSLPRAKTSLFRGRNNSPRISAIKVPGIKHRGGTFPSATILCARWNCSRKRRDDRDASENAFSLVKATTTGRLRRRNRRPQKGPRRKIDITARPLDVGVISEDDQVRGNGSIERGAGNGSLIPTFTGGRKGER